MRRGVWPTETPSTWMSAPAGSDLRSSRPFVSSITVFFSTNGPWRVSMMRSASS